MADLITTLEQLTGPSREVDAKICRHLVGNPKDHWYDFLGKWTTDDTCVELTASLDATIALCERVLPGFSWEARKSGFGNGQASIWNPMVQPSPGVTIRVDHPSSPAIALLVALLRAKEASNG